MGRHMVAALPGERRAAGRAARALACRVLWRLRMSQRKAFSRRRFLGAATGMAAAGALARPRAALAQQAVWNPRPSGLFGACDPVYNVLEIFLYGGLSPWETFFIRSDDASGGDWAYWRNSRTGFSQLTGTCAGTSVEAFTNDAEGNPISFGPATRPLWPFLDRMRVVVMRHDLLPHEAAIPLALSGLRPGNPRMAGIGAPIQRRAGSLATGAAPLPRSYVLIPPQFSGGDNLAAATSIGAHPGDCRPLELRLGNSQALLGQLARSNVGGFGGRDALLASYRDRYGHELSWQGAGAPLRSKHFSVYGSSLSRVQDASRLMALLQGASLAPVSMSACAGSGSNPTYGTSTALRLAAHLFNAPEPARYVCAIDGGVFQPGGAAYDAHGDLAQTTTVNLYTMLSELAALITPPSLQLFSPIAPNRLNPGGPVIGPPTIACNALRMRNPAPIDLDRTLIVLNTEFGRSPGTTGANGREHWPDGYVTVLLGGPITRRGVAGSIRSGGDAQVSGPGTAFTPTELQGAALLAAGVRPLHQDIYGIGDFGPACNPPGTDEDTLMRNLARNVLGLPV